MFSNQELETHQNWKWKNFNSENTEGGRCVLNIVKDSKEGKYSKV